MRDTEKYDLQAFFHLNSESVLIGQKTKLLIRPKLTLNNHTVSIKNLKSSLLEIRITDNDGKKINYTVRDAQFSDDSEFIYEFMVPPNTKDI